MTGPNRPHSVRDRFGEQLAKRRDRLSPSGQKVARYINDNRHAVLGQSALEIGLQTQSSDATVIRTVQTLGFRGLVELKAVLEEWLGETDSPVEKMASTTRHLDGKSDAAIDFVVESQSLVLKALQSAENRQAVAQAVELLGDAESVGFFGIGASGQLADYGARLFQRVGLPAYSYAQTGVMLAEALLQMRRGQVLIMLAHGRAHREAKTALAEAKRLDIPVVAVTGRADSPICAEARAAIILPRARSDKLALHAGGLIALETLHLAYSIRYPEQGLETLNRLVGLRASVRPHSS